jgi:hypothetical protein
VTRFEVREPAVRKLHRRPLTGRALPDDRDRAAVEVDDRDVASSEIADVARDDQVLAILRQLHELHVAVAAGHERRLAAGGTDRVVVLPAVALRLKSYAVIVRPEHRAALDRTHTVSCVKQLS